MTNTTETCQERAMRESKDTGPAANFNRASAGYCPDVLLAMLASLPGADGFYTYSGNRTADTVIGHRDNHLGDYHDAMIRGAATRLRGYGLRVRVARQNGKADRLTVYGPKQGGSDGRYSA